jgi:hypothetical protein
MFASYAKPPDPHAADENELSTQRNSFEDVGSASYTRVEHNLGKHLL